MKLFVCSDLHSEFWPNDDKFDWFFDGLIDSDDVDVAVLAGDILLGRNSLRFLEKVCERYKNVVHCCGNHEFYHGDFDAVLRRFRRMRDEVANYHFLERETVEIDGQRFVGCTLFYQGGRDCLVNEMFMNDFRLIHKEGGYRNFIYKYAQDSKAWLKETVKAEDIVVTHMLPHSACIDNSYRSSGMNGFYYNNCDAILRENKPKLWLHGHSHNHYDEKIYDTRIVRNPHGYPGERGVNFQKNKKIDA